MPVRDAYPTAEPFLPRKISLLTLREAAENCKGCDLFRNATQVVFGEGPRKARVLFVGEQPGDQEDLAGHPFVGPSGHMLNEVLRRVGIDRSDTYVTNAVKHFKFVQRGKRRLHQKPTARQVAACKPWLREEIAVVKPAILVALGATATFALVGNAYKVLPWRGRPIRENDWGVKSLILTVHPSSLLRTPDPAARADAIAAFEHDLAVVRTEMEREE